MDRIYLDDKFKLQASAKAQGLKPYYIQDGKITPITVSVCVNRWGKIYLMTDAEFTEAQKVESKVAELIKNWQKQMELANELLESTIVHNIINK